MQERAEMLRIVLERRAEPSLAMSILSPLLAVCLTLAASAVLFLALGKDPLKAMHAYFVAPLIDPWSLQELIVKATPLVMIGVGLSFCYLSNNWNIGAEGQYVMGGIFGGWAALLFHQSGSPLGVPAVMAMGAAGGMLLALVPAVLKVRLGTNEILTSLMLVYIAELLLDYLVRGPWRDPRALNFPQSVTFDVGIPILVEGSRIHVGAALAVVAAGFRSVSVSSPAAASSPRGASAWAAQPWRQRQRRRASAAAAAPPPPRRRRRRRPPPPPTLPTMFPPRYAAKSPRYRGRAYGNHVANSDEAAAVAETGRCTTSAVRIGPSASRATRKRTARAGDRDSMRPIVRV
jgi:hypothetical protein